MKLLNRLRELRHELHPEWTTEEIDGIDIKANQHIETIGIGATTIDDITRLNITYFNIENSNVDFMHNQY